MSGILDLIVSKFRPKSRLGIKSSKLSEMWLSKYRAVRFRAGTGG
jgi:hypothetical protein